uniref:Uncharacterized protein LOC101508023 n=1 Tax=Cicer arietinum TaxID=3827 RepID=A0A1S2Z5A1_CICAR|nr:uncharacterized protein LOC101508023 [Cicer arietinum]
MKLRRRWETKFSFLRPNEEEFLVLEIIEKGPMGLVNKSPINVFVCSVQILNSLCNTPKTKTMASKGQSTNFLKHYGYDLLLGSIAAFYTLMVPYTKVKVPKVYVHGNLENKAVSCQQNLAWLSIKPVWLDNLFEIC